MVCLSSAAGFIGACTGQAALYASVASAFPRSHAQLPGVFAVSSLRRDGVQLCSVIAEVATLPPINTARPVVI